MSDPAAREPLLPTQRRNVPGYKENMTPWQYYKSE